MTTSGWPSLRHHLLEASELVDGFGERLWPRTQLVQKLSEPCDGMVPSVTISDHAGDNRAIEFEVVAAGRKPDQSVGHQVPGCRQGSADQPASSGRWRRCPSSGGSFSLLQPPFCRPSPTAHDTPADLAPAREDPGRGTFAGLLRLVPFRLRCEGIVELALDPHSRLTSVRNHVPACAPLLVNRPYPDPGTAVGPSGVVTTPGAN